ncbi:hypothetical protein Ddye_008884 [Dipteronia dyeriana]|uniref:Peptidyl-prolyl cis-trans isomerase n=1 Tax=Dipteronia dyeriana TaxID=168575 RepID=A0AAD9XAP7_9ROSI|nr:hypothetical protein Ddye_008884 [Dipteronia dyeriana]
MANLTMFFDLSIGGHPASRIVMKLFIKSTLITSENVWALYTGKKGIGTVGNPLLYKGSTFHHMIPGYMVHGCKSIYGPSFTDENFVKKHIGLGILSMVKIGIGDNNSQFCICIANTECLDGKQVIFGQVIKGFVVLKTVDKIDSSSSITSKPVLVVDCGEL